MLDGGRSAASGFLYQYVRTIEALLDVADLESVAALYVEGRPASASELVAESVDYELVDHGGGDGDIGGAGVSSQPVSANPPCLVTDSR